MKRFAVLIMIMYAILILGACSDVGEQLEKVDTLETEKVVVMDERTGKSIESTHLDDNTIQLDNAFSVSEYYVIQEVSAAADFATVYPDLESVYSAASNVLVGVVTDIQYTDDDAIPRTIYSFQVLENLKGSVQAGSLISISESNGYVRMSTFIDTYGDDHFENLTDEEIEIGVILQSLGGAPLPSVGEEYVVFLGEQKVEGRIAGAYAVLGNFMGKYVLDTESERYSRFCPAEDATLYSVEDPRTRTISVEQPMTLEEIKAIIEQTT